jgi:hypothetical protein
MMIKHEIDGETQNTELVEYEEDDAYVQIVNNWHHDAEGVLIPRAKIAELITALAKLQ